MIKDPAPFTEDMLDEHTHALLELGASDRSATLRTRLQCPSLVSDMEAFKVSHFFKNVSFFCIILIPYLGG